MRNRARYAVASILVSLLTLHSHSASTAERALEVTATAYNSVESQTNKQPRLAAWGDLLAPGMQVIAVSRDLLKVHGLSRGSIVRIDGLAGHFVVLDKMNRRWRRRIDVYMGSDVQGARAFGRRSVTIRWGAPAPKAATEPTTSASLVAEAESP